MYLCASNAVLLLLLLHAHLLDRCSPKPKTSGGARSESGAPKQRFDQNAKYNNYRIVSVRVSTTCQHTCPLRIWTPRLPTPTTHKAIY